MASKNYTQTQNDQLAVWLSIKAGDEKVIRGTSTVIAKQATEELGFKVRHTLAQAGSVASALRRDHPSSLRDELAKLCIESHTVIRQLVPPGARLVDAEGLRLLVTDIEGFVVNIETGEVMKPSDLAYPVEVRRCP